MGTKFTECRNGNTAIKQSFHDIPDAVYAGQIAIYGCVVVSCVKGEKCPRRCPVLK